ncbi:MAG: diguanylate cyclase [Thiotrichales bacterium]|nr:diguanylate cyclase [Thiotrichales bacterium]
MEKTADIEGHVADVSDVPPGDAETPDIVTTPRLVDEFQDVRHLYDQTPTGITIGLIASTLMAWWLMAFVPDYIVLPWLSFIALTSILHLFVVKQFRQSGSYIGISNNWVSYNAFLFSMLGLAWSTGYLFFFPHLNTSQQMFLYYAAGMLAIGLLPVLSAVVSGYITFLGFLALPLLFLLVGQEWDLLVLGITCISCSYIILSIIAKNYQLSLKHSYSLASTVSKQAREIYEDNEQTRFTNLKLKKEAENCRKESRKIVNEKEQALKTLQSINDGVITTDNIGKITFINPVAEVYLGREKRELIGKRIDSLFNLVEEKTRKKQPIPVEKCLNSKSIINSNGTSILLRRDGIEYAVEYTLTPITDRQSNAIGTALVFRDVTEKRELEQNLTWQASHDQLTGLINRREFDKRLSKIISSDNAGGNEHALCFIDLDNFKIINDSCGHLAGDELLAMIANCLKKKTRDTDTIARIGGDEFGVIFYGCALAKAKLITEIFREQIEKLEFEWDGKSYKVTASIGIIAIDENYKELSDVLQAADLSYYTAKENGKNQISLLDEGKKVVNESRTRIQWVEKIRECLNKQSFELHTQEIRPLDDMNEITMCENLLRINDGNGLILPAQYMPAIKRYHMMPEIDRWVVKASMEMLEYGGKALGKYNIITINLSEQSVNDEKFSSYIKNLLAEYDINAERICFDIPESNLYNNAARTEKFICSVREAGCKIAIDDFSSGLEIFKTLKSLNIDFVKFNGRLPIPHSDKCIEYSIVESINNISHMIGVQTVAKYISDDDNLEALYEIGVDYAQGFLLSKPKAIT